MTGLEPNPSPVAPHEPLRDFYADPASRPTWVRGMFDRTAHHYDWISSAMSFGSDKWYRQHTLEEAGLRPGQRVLDVATGTGLVAAGALGLGLPAKDVVGLDPSFGMLVENRRLRPIPLLRAMGETMPIASESFDFVTMGYALRHVADLVALFSEFRRVLKPGGKVLILEITRPTSRLAMAGMRFYMRGIVPGLARLRRDPELARLMEYYWATIEACVPPATILDALGKAGLAEPRRGIYGGIFSQYTAHR